MMTSQRKSILLLLCCLTKLISSARTRNLRSRTSTSQQAQQTAEERRLYKKPVKFVDEPDFQAELAALDLVTDAADEHFFLRIKVLDILGNFIEGDNITSQRASLSVFGTIDASFSGIPVVYFEGLGQETTPADVIPIHRQGAAGIGDLLGNDLAMVSMHWYGEDDGSTASATLTAHGIDGVLSGSVFDGNYTYKIGTIKEEDGSLQYECHIVHVDEMPDELELPVDTGNESFLLSEGFDPFSDSDGQRNLAVEQMQILDIMVMYTGQAKTDAGGEANMLADIELALWQTNMAFENSQSTLRVRLAHTQEATAFPDTPDSNALSALYDKSDGHFDDIDILRQENGADSVILIASHVGGYCGIGKIGKPYAVVNRFCSTLNGQYSFAHEVGHQLFAFHDQDTMGTRVTEHWRHQNYGYIDELHCFRTIMSYNRCSCGRCNRILYFSNLRSHYQGFRTGTNDAHNIEYMEIYGEVLGKLMNPITETPSSAPNLVSSIDPELDHSLGVLLCTQQPCEVNPTAASTHFTVQSSNATGMAPTVPTNLQNIRLLKIPQGFYIEIFDKSGFKGNRRVLASTSEDQTLKLKSYNFEAGVKSFRVRTVPNETVKLCRDLGCDSDSTVHRRVGSFQKLPKAIHNKLSRMILPPGFKVTIYDKKNFAGKKRTFANTHAIDSLNLRFRKDLKDWNDRTKSIIISTLETNKSY